MFLLPDDISPETVDEFSKFKRSEAETILLNLYGTDC